MGLLDDQKDWSDQLKMRVNDFIKRNRITHVHQILEIINLINWAREEMEIETQETVSEWYPDQTVTKP
jgi:hypothetical protein